MKTAMFFLYGLVAVLAGVVIWQQITINKLVKPAAGTGTGNTASSDSSGRFGDFIKGVQDQMEPKEVTVKF